jgi:MFS transporter, AAHS family, 3-hydroxyphenylpropionic acid transporter
MTERGAAVATTIVFCALVALCEGIDLQAAGVAASGIAAEFKPSPGQMGLVNDGLTRVEAASTQIGFNIGGAVSAVLMGHHMSRRGRNRAIVITFVALPLLLLMLAKAPPALAVIASIVFALGCSIMAAQAFLYAMAPLPYPTAIRGIGVGAAVAAGRIGSIVGPKLGGVLRAAGHDSSQLLLDLLPIIVLASACALWLAWNSRNEGGAADA